MPVLIGKTCSLRPLAQSDMPYFLRWHQDKDLRNATLGFRFPTTAEMEAGWFTRMLNEQSGQIAFFSICSTPKTKSKIEDTGNAPVGSCRLVDIDWISRQAELGIMIGDMVRRGQGIGKEATAMLCRYAFNDLNLRRLFLRVHADNDHAIKLYEKLDFKVEGRLRQHVYLDGQYHDVLLMGLLADESMTIDRILS